MKAKIFVDTSAWYALIDADDANHQAARRFLKKALVDYPSLVTSNHVIGETYTLLRFRLGHAVAMQFLERLGQSPRVERVFISQRWEDATYSLLAQYADQDFSFVDATSFIAMNALGIKEAFAFDSHFVVASFAVLPLDRAKRGGHSPS